MNDFERVLDGARVLIIEDDYFVASDLDLLIEDAGGHVVALVGNNFEALHLLATERVDAVVLDLCLADGQSTPTLDVLTARGTPVVVHTGADLPPGFKQRYPHVEILPKPAASRGLMESLDAVLQRASRLTTAA